MRYYDASLDLLATADTNGYFTRVNPAWERTLGYSPETLCSTTVHRLRASRRPRGDDRRAAATGRVARHRRLSQSLPSPPTAAIAGWNGAPRPRRRGRRSMRLARDVTVLHEAEDQLANNARGPGTDDRRAHARARRRARGDAAPAGDRGGVSRRRDLSAHRACRAMSRRGSRSGLELPAGQVTLLRHAAPLHDVGKLAIPDRILLKPGQADRRRSSR